MIGRVELQNGLYYLQARTNSFTTNLISSGLVVNNDIDVWHNRLGHPFGGVSYNICSKLSYVHFNKNNGCEPCHLAKQHKLPFTMSNYVSKHVMSHYFLLFICLYFPIFISDLCLNDYYFLNFIIWASYTRNS